MICPHDFIYLPALLSFTVVRGYVCGTIFSLQSDGVSALHIHAGQTAAPSVCCDMELFAARAKRASPGIDFLHQPFERHAGDLRYPTSRIPRHEVHTLVLTLQFHDLPELILGPSRAFSVEGQALRQHPDDEVVARRAHGMWHVQDAYAQDAVSYGFECSSPAYLQFEDRQGRTSPRYGPFDDVVFRGEHVLVEKQNFAELLPVPQQWKHALSGIRWPILNLLTARA